MVGSIRVIMFFLLINVTDAQVNYYVNGSLGNDIPGNGIGTGSSAWKSIEYAINNVADPTSSTIIINVSDSIYDLLNNQIDISRNFTNLTILGQSTNNTIVQASTDLASSTSRVFQIYAGNNVTLKNLTIRYGKITVNGNGGGVYNNGGNLTIDYCKITENSCTANGLGAGIASNRGNLVIKNSTISFNSGTTIPDSAFYGGGIGMADGSANIFNSTIHDNSAPSGGGIAIFLNESFAISNVVFNIENSTITQNVATNRCGGVRLSFIPEGIANSYFLYSNINSFTIFNNSSTGNFGIGGIGDLSEERSELNIKNTIVSGNNASLRPNIYGTLISGGYNLVQDTSGGIITGFTNSNIIGSDPNLMSLADNFTTNGTQTCAIPESSPAEDIIPAASPNGAPLFDQRGFERIGDYDIGSYEYSDLSDVDNDKQLPTNFALEQNYPNPFNPSTKISWQSTVSSWQTLKVYDILGNEVATLVDEYRPAGEYEVEFQTSIGNRQLANGVYYYRLQDGGYVETKKMILLK